MKINRLFSLELERNSLRPYQIAVEVGTVFILGFIYLMAAIPKIDPGDSDAELFSSYKFCNRTDIGGHDGNFFCNLGNDVIKVYCG